MQILNYKGYEGSVEIDMERLVCRGKLLFVTDLVTYEGPLTEIQKEFEAAVDDYLETCAELGRKPNKPLKGAFNVRVPPELHKAAYVRAMQDDTSMNDIVVQALSAYLESDKKMEHNHNHMHTHQVVVANSGEREAIPSRIFVGTGSPKIWTESNGPH